LQPQVKNTLGKLKRAGDFYWDNRNFPNRDLHIFGFQEKKAPAVDEKTRGEGTRN